MNWEAVYFESWLAILQLFLFMSQLDYEKTGVVNKTTTKLSTILVICRQNCLVFTVAVNRQGVSVSAVKYY